MADSDVPSTPTAADKEKAESSGLTSSTTSSSSSAADADKEKSVAQAKLDLAEKDDDKDDDDETSGSNGPKSSLPDTSSLGKKKVLVKVGMIGDSEIGKTSLMVKYVQGNFNEDYIQTLGVNFMEKNNKFEED